MAQDVENDFQYRTSFTLNTKLVKKLKLNLSPEMRFDEAFAMDKYLIEAKLAYKPLKFLAVGANYRFIGNIKKDKSTEYLHRFAFSTTFSKDFGRFKPAIRIMYSDYADDDESKDDKFMRYKGKIEYDIAKCKLTPFIGVEAFQQMSDSKLYKMRYSVGADYKLFKKNYLGVSYKLDYYQLEYRNKHIFSLGYKLKL